MEGKIEKSRELDLKFLKLFEEALQFYANKENYKNQLISKDNGNLARFVLKQAKELLDYESQIMEELKSLVDEMNKDNTDQYNIDDFKSTIEQLKNLFNNK